MKLHSSTKYWWSVKIWNKDGEESAWSAPQHFEMGLLNEHDWQDAKWLSLEKDTRKSEYHFREIQSNRMEQPELRTSYPAGYFRKEIKLKGKVESARAYVCGLGYYELYLNGKKVGDHLLDPVPTSYDELALYVPHDITTFLKNQENVVGLILGDGFYGQDIAFNAKRLAYGKPAFKLLVKIQFKDGRVEEIVSDGTWKANTGPIVFDNVYGGETYDARYEMPGWNGLAFNDSGWQGALVDTPHVKQVKAQLLPPIRKTRELAPVNIFGAANGNWIVDFGQNISGWVKMEVEEESGTPISITMAESLYRTGDAINTESAGKFATAVDQIEMYICKGGGKEKWEPRFTYHGFQFAEIAGLSHKPDPGSIRAILVHNDVKETGSFTSADPMLNKMLEVSKWTVVDNLHGFPEDCPHREKCGWLGDAHATAQFCMYHYDMALFYQKYSNDIESQLDYQKGKYSGKEKIFRVPYMIAPGKRKANIATLDWGIAEIYVPWYLYLHYGDQKPIEDHYAEMKEMVQYYLTFKNEKGVVENGLGDWCPPLWDRRDNPGAMECHPYISANAYFYDILKIMKRIAGMMDDAEFAALADKELMEIGRSFNENFLAVIEGTDHFWYGSQTATVMTLQFNMVPDSVRGKVVVGLLYDISVTHGGHHSTGIHGNRYIYSLLSELGEESLAYELLCTPDFPSQAYILNAGLNTWPERQWEWDSGIEWNRSLNHPMQAGFTAFFYESIAGIEPLPDQPGFREFLIKPHLMHQLQSAGAELDSPYGRILSKWSVRDGNATLQLEIPFNTRARVILPTTDEDKVRVNGEKREYAKQAEFNNEPGFQLGSGSYTITFKI